MKYLLSIIFFSAVCLSSLYAQQPNLKELKGDDLNGTITPTEKKGKWGYINEKGKFVIKPVFDYASPFDDGFAIIKFEEKYGVIDRSANYKFAPLYDRISKLFLCDGERNYMVEIDGKKGLTDRNYDMLLEPKVYVDIVPYCAGNKNFFVCSTEKKKVFIDYKDNFYQFPTSQYDDIKWNESDSCFILRNDSLYGYTTGDFTFILDPCLNYIPNFSSGPIQDYNELQEPVLVTRKGIYSIDDYDDILFQTLNYKQYEKDKTIPIWAKKHIKSKDVEKGIESSSVSYQRINSSNLIHQVSNGTGNVFNIGGGKKLYFPTKVKEEKGSDELWHDIHYVSWFDNTILCFYRDYNTNESVMQFYKYKNPLDSFYYAAPYADNYSIGDLYTHKGEGIPFKPLINNVLQKYEKLTDNYTVFPLQFCVLNNGNNIVLFRIRYNGTNKVIGYGMPQYTTIMGQTVLVNDGVYTERHYDFLEIALIVDRKGNVINCLHLPDYRNNQIMLDRLGGFFCVGGDNPKSTYNIFVRSSEIIVNHDSPILKFNNKGELEWRYTPTEGQFLCDLEGTTDMLYGIGKTTSQGIIGQNNSLIITLNNEGKIQDTEVGKGQQPHNTIKIYKGNLYVDGGLHKLLVLPKPICRWTSWRGKKIGGCGLYDVNTHSWVIHPVLSHSSPITKEGWTIYPFEGDKAKVVKDGKTMYIDMNGRISNE